MFLFCFSSAIYSSGHLCTFVKLVRFVYSCCNCCFTIFLQWWQILGKYKPLVDCDGILCRYYAWQYQQYRFRCWLFKVFGRGKWSNFNIPVDLRRRPYNTVTTQYDVTECVCNTCVFVSAFVLSTAYLYVIASEVILFTFNWTGLVDIHVGFTVPGNKGLRDEEEKLVTYLREGAEEVKSHDPEPIEQAVRGYRQA